MNQKGFTLIELAIVIAIIGILAAVAVPKFTDLTDSAQQATAESFLGSLQSAAAIYVAQQRVPPTVFSDFVTTGATATNTKYTVSTQGLSGVTVAGTAGTQMTLTYSGGGTATYTLVGTDVSAGYASF